jgi:hypothetical protein
MDRMDTPAEDGALPLRVFFYHYNASMSAHPRNSPGDFYVERECCALCGALMDDTGDTVAPPKVDQIAEELARTAKAIVAESKQLIAVSNELREAGRKRRRDKCDSRWGSPPSIAER